MSTTQKMNFSTYSTFGEVFKSAWKIVSNVAKGKDYHIISGSYKEQSIMKCQRIKRSEANPIEFANLEINSPIPPVMGFLDIFGKERTSTSRLPSDLPLSQKKPLR